MFKLTIIITLFSLIDLLNGKPKKYAPPHCTQLTKDTDYVSHFKYDYPITYIVPGQREAYQKLFCINPAAVNKAVTTVCDWSAAPEVQFTLGDEYVHVVRQDPANKYLGYAVITTNQLCGHDMVNASMYEADSVFVAQI